MLNHTLGMAMAIISNSIDFLSNMSNTYIAFNEWRAFMFLTAIPSIIGFILVYQFPESPRYLMYRGRMIESRDILEKVYTLNHKKTAVSYPVLLLYYITSSF